MKSNLLIKKILWSSLLLLAMHTGAQNQTGITHSRRSTQQPAFPLESYEELENPASADSKSWKNFSGTAVAWGDKYTRYKKETRPVLSQSPRHSVEGWKGERVSAQFVISSTVDMEHVSVEMADLVHISGKHTISLDRVHKGFVRYTMADCLKGDGSGSCDIKLLVAPTDSVLVADPIDHINPSLFIRKQTSQGYWIRVWIPQNALTGQYTTRITVKNNSEILGSLKLDVQVLSRTLPEPSKWSFHLDLWQNPFAVARYYRVPLWSEAHFRALKKEMKPYADAGGKVITVPIMHKPWNGQTYDPFETMVTWIKRADGSWMFDYTVFDRWVEFMMKEIGVTREIGCYSMIPWKLSFKYYDQASNSMQELKTKPGEKAYHDLWVEVLRNLAGHLKEKGWFDITHIAMDERPKEDMLTALQIVREADPHFKISLAGALHEELTGELDDYCVALSMKYTGEMKKKRKQQGKITTFYTCCAEPYPNTYTFSNPAESEWLAWYAAKEELDGYLRWALNSWVLEPLLDSRFYSWGAGDTFLIYPGGRSCMRLEYLVAGIQAYEKIKMLREEFQRLGKKQQEKRLNKILRTFDEVQLSAQPADLVVRKANRLLNSF